MPGPRGTLPGHHHIHPNPSEHLKAEGEGTFWPFHGVAVGREDAPAALCLSCPTWPHPASTPPAHQCWSASAGGRSEPLSPASGDLGAEENLTSPHTPAARGPHCQAGRSPHGFAATSRWPEGGGVATCHCLVSGQPQVSWAGSRGRWTNLGLRGCPDQVTGTGMTARSPLLFVHIYLQELPADLDLFLQTRQGQQDTVVTAGSGTLRALPLGSSSWVPK